MLTPNDLSSDQNPSRAAGKKNVRVLAITGGKGGIGKTNVSVNLGVSMAKQGLNVMLLDADLALANVDVLLGLKVQYDLSHVMSGEVDLEHIIKKGPGGMKIIPASSGVHFMTKLSTMQLSGLINAFTDVCGDTDVLLIDTAAGVSEDVVTFSKAAQEIILVVCDEPTSITDAYAAIKIFSKDHKISNFKILVNMAHAPHEGREVYAKLMRACDKFLDVTLEYIGALPYDDNLRKAVQKQKAVVDMYPGTKVSQAFKKLSQKITDSPIKAQGGDQISFFLERLVS